jgi:hypothetical protein
MRRIAAIVYVGALLLFLLALHGLSSETPAPQPLTLPLGCTAKDCPLLEGRPQTAGLRSGFVRLKPGESVGWHTTGINEEELIILKGRGKRLSKDSRQGRLCRRGWSTFLPRPGTTWQIRLQSSWNMCMWLRRQRPGNERTRSESPLSTSDVGLSLNRRSPGAKSFPPPLSDMS